MFKRYRYIAKLHKPCLQIKPSGHQAGAYPGFAKLKLIASPDASIVQIAIILSERRVDCDPRAPSGSVAIPSLT